MVLQKPTIFVIDDDAPVRKALLCLLREGAGNKISIVSNRPMSFWELRSNTRSTDYQSMVTEIRLDKEGGLKGGGKLA